MTDDPILARALGTFRKSLGAVDYRGYPSYSVADMETAFIAAAQVLRDSYRQEGRERATDHVLKVLEGIYGGGADDLYFTLIDALADARIGKWETS